MDKSVQRVTVLASREQQWWCACARSRRIFRTGSKQNIQKRNSNELKKFMNEFFVKNGVN